VSYSKLNVEGPAPFKEAGVYEVQISIVGEKPSEDEIKDKTFSSLWSGNFHLRIKKGSFTETLGSADNPIPESVYAYDKIWIIVNDLLSSLYSVFDVDLETPLKETKSFTPEPVPSTIS